MRVNRQQLAYWRQKSVLTKKELAQASGVAPSTYYALEAGVHETARPRTIRKIASVLGVEAHRLVVIGKPSADGNPALSSFASVQRRPEHTDAYASLDPRRLHISDLGA